MHLTGQSNGWRGGKEQETEREDLHDEEKTKKRW